MLRLSQLRKFYLKDGIFCFESTSLSCAFFLEFPKFFAKLDMTAKIVRVWFIVAAKER